MFDTNPQESIDTEITEIRNSDLLKVGKISKIKNKLDSIRCSPGGGPPQPIAPFVPVAPIAPEPAPIFCLGENTKILSEKGYVAISSLSIGDNVYSDTNQLTTIKEIVVETKKNRQIYKINNLVLTSDHLVFTQNGWKCIDPDHYKNRLGKFLPSNKEIVALDRIPVNNISKLELNDVILTIDGYTTVDSLIKLDLEDSFKVYAIVTETGSIVANDGIIVDAYGIKIKQKELV